MNVKFTVDYDLIELVDAIGLDYNIVDAESDVIKNYKEIEIVVNDVDEGLSLVRDEDLCAYVLNETLCEALIYTDRYYD